MTIISLEKVLIIELGFHSISVCRIITFSRELGDRVEKYCKFCLLYTYVLRNRSKIEVVEVMRERK